LLFHWPISIEEIRGEERMAGRRDDGVERIVGEEKRGGQDGGRGKGKEEERGM
jgi:hypothetical protein